jgi:DNA polymerase III alpha subunit
LNIYRNNLPDIDLDFPHNVRDEVFLKIQLKWPNKVARISNHVYFHEKSALRQAFRNVGIRKFIGKNDIQNELKKLTYQFY